MLDAATTIIAMLTMAAIVIGGFRCLDLFTDYSTKSGGAEFRQNMGRAAWAVGCALVGAMLLYYLMEERNQRRAVEYRNARAEKLAEPPTIRKFGGYVCGASCKAHRAGWLAARDSRTTNVRDCDTYAEGDRRHAEGCYVWVRDRDVVLEPPDLSDDSDGRYRSR
jgi:hypothetical protein